MAPIRAAAQSRQPDISTGRQFIEELKARKIGASVHFIPIHLHPYYREKYRYRPEDFPVAYEKLWTNPKSPFKPSPLGP